MHSTEIDHVMNCIFNKLLSACGHHQLKSQALSGKKAFNGMKIANFETSPQKCTPSPLLISVVVKHFCEGWPLACV